MLMQKEDHRTRVAAERRAKMRRRLFVSTAQLVAKKGTAATSIDDVITVAEVSRGTFYKYFDSPDSLFDQLALEIANEIICTAEPAVLLLNDPAERVAAGMRLVIHMSMRNHEIAGFLARLGWPEPRAGDVVLEFVQRDLKEGLRSGQFIEMPINLALNIVSMTVLGSVHAMLASPNVEQAVASALRALGIDAKKSARVANMQLPHVVAVEGGLLGVNGTATSLSPHPE